jgi:hypothetical protein
MPTRVFALDEESRKHLHALLMNIFLDGECYAFATALHEGLGWPLMGIVGTDGVVYHAAVQAPDGRFFDARGYVSLRDFSTPFSLPRQTLVQPVTLEMFTRKGEPAFAREHSVASARRMAEDVWPELPWKDSAAARAMRFCEELEVLSRKHGLWIRSPYPTARPHLAESGADEAGYELRRAEGGFSFTLDRYFSD